MILNPDHTYVLSSEAALEQAASAEWLDGRPGYAMELLATRRALRRFLELPPELLVEVIRGLTKTEGGACFMGVVVETTP